MTDNIDTAAQLEQPATAARRFCVGIVGAGNVGCFIGAHLCQDSMLQVKFFGREAMALQLAAHGLSAGAKGRRTLYVQPVAFYTSLNSLLECDVVLLTVKATALMPMLGQLKRLLRPDIPIVALQNGIGIGEMLSQDLPNPIVRAIVPFNIVTTKPGHFYQTTEGQLLWQQSELPAVKYLTEVLKQQHLAVQYCTDIKAAEFGKLLLNLNNALNALSDLPLQKQLLQRSYRLLLAAAMQEWLTICKSIGVKPLAYTRLPNSLLPAVLRLPTILFRHIARAMLAIDDNARSSMWQDLQAHRQTEIMFLNGAVSRIGQQCGIATPVNDMLAELIKRKEHGQFTRADLAMLMRLNVSPASD